MGPGITEVERALLALAPEERAEVIRFGLQSLEDGPEGPSPHEVDEGWRDELGRRVDDVIEGRVELGTFAATRAHFERRHPHSAG